MRIISILSVFLLSGGNTCAQNEISIDSLIRHFNDYPLKFRSFVSKKMKFKLTDTRTYELGLLAKDEFVNGKGITLEKGYSVNTILAAKGKGLKNINYIKGSKGYLKTSFDRIEKYIDHPNFDGDGVFESITISGIPQDIGQNIMNELSQIGAVEVHPCAIPVSEDFKAKFFCLNKVYRIEVKIPQGEKTTYNLWMYKN